MLTKMKNIKAQVGETVTWVIATIIILAILMFFIFGATTLSSTKSLKGFKVSFVSSKVFEEGDAFLKKSLFTYHGLTDMGEREYVMQKLKKMENRSEFNLDLEETNKKILKRVLAR